MRFVKNDLNNTLNVGLYDNSYSYDRLFSDYNLLYNSDNFIINEILDGEVKNYKFYSDILSFNVYFLAFFDKSSLSLITKYNEDYFDEHVKQSKIAFGLLNEDLTIPDKIFNSVYEHRNTDNILNPNPVGYQNISSFDAMKDKPLYIRDFVGELSAIKPRVGGLPIFYNSFSIPYWMNKDAWINNDLLFNNKPFFHASFLLMEFFDSTETLTQNRLFSIIIHPNEDMFNEVIDNRILVKRPVFNLNKNHNGYNFTFLKSYDNSLYVKFSFWDALNGRKLTMIPSTEKYNLFNNSIMANTQYMRSDTIKFNTKKWIQSLDGFNNNNLYLKVNLNDDNTFKLYEYNNKTLTFNINANKFDLYELYFDDFWVKTPVLNLKPTNDNIEPNTTLTNNPLLFDIKNIDESIIINKQSINYDDDIYYESETLKSLFGDYIDNILDYVNPLVNIGNHMYLGERVTINQPVNNIPIHGVGSEIINFSFTNITDDSYRITNASFVDIKIIGDGDENYNDNTLNTKFDTWSSGDRQILAENLTIIGNNINLNLLTAKNILNITNIAYLCFESLMGNLNMAINQNYAMAQHTNNFLSKIYYELAITTPNFDVIAANEVYDEQGSDDDIIAALYEFKAAYLLLKNNDLDKYRYVNNIAIDYLVNLIDNNINSFNLIPSVMNKLNNTNDYYDNEFLIDMIKFMIINNYVGLSHNDSQIINNLDVINVDSSIIRQFLATTYLTINTPNNFYLNYDDIVNCKLSFIFGNKITPFLISDNYNVSGKIRLTIEESSNNIKNIIIPLNFNIKVK